MDICGEILRLEMRARQVKMSRIVLFLTSEITDSVSATFPTKMFWFCGLFLGFLGCFWFLGVFGFWGFFC